MGELISPAETAGMKPVANGQMYRQMFDAEVQLVNSLETSKAARREHSMMQNEKTFLSTIPLVPNAFPHFLEERQKTWATSLPNDWKTENPVLRRYNTLNAKKPQEQKKLASLDEESVAGLPEIVPVAGDNARSAKTKELITKLEAGRKERHAAALEDMEQELAEIAKACGEDIARYSQEANDFLERQQDEIDRLLSTLSANESLREMEDSSLDQVWEAIQQLCGYRQEAVGKLNKNLSDVEETRRKKVFDVLRKYFKIFERIAHLLPVDVRRMMEKEIQTMNEVMMENDINLVECQTLLMKHEFELERDLRSAWSKRKSAWSDIKLNIVLDNFKLFIASPEVSDPPGVNEILERLYQQQQTINDQRKDLVESLRDSFKPPKAQKSTIYQWHSNMNKLSKQLLAVQEAHLTQLHSEYEKVCNKCLDQLEVFKEEIVRAGICDESQLQDALDAQFLPLVGQQQKKFEAILEHMDTCLEHQNKGQFESIKALFKLCQGLAFQWDQHEAGLANQERTMQETLDANRNRNDALNQEREANLDLAIDKMRQETSESGLRSTLKHVLEILDRIQAGYEEFLTQQEKIVKKYPTMVHQEVQLYDDNLCKFFGVSRKSPGDEGKSGKGKKPTTSGSTPVPTKTPVPQKTPREDAPPATDRSGKSNKSTTPAPHEAKETKESKLKKSVKELLQTAGGVQFYVMSVAPPEGFIEDETSSEAHAGKSSKAGGKSKKEKRSSVDTNIALGSEDIATGSLNSLDREVEAEVAKTPDEYLTSYDLPNSYFIAVKKQIRQEFLEHLVKWRSEADQRAQSIVGAKTNELKNELQLKKHLHAPRAKRAELDIHNVRAAELVMHAERVERHVKGIRETLNDLRKEFVDMSGRHDMLHDEFKLAIQKLEADFINATKSQKLQEIQTALKKEKEGFMSKIRSDLRTFRQKMDDTSQMLREANSKFIKSFKVFSEGGNFCVEEIEEYKARLDRISTQIEQTEGVIMADLENMESSRMDRLGSVTSTFESKFKHHMADLTFIEKLARWLTNTQLKIKTEASESNTQSQTLALLLKKIGRKVDAIQAPSPDKEDVTAIELQEWLVTVMDTFNARAEYLDCLKSPVTQAAAATGATGTQQTGKVGFSDVKKGTEESAMRIMKNIFSAQREKVAQHDSQLLGDGGPVPAGAKREDGGGAEDKSRATLSRRSNLSDSATSKNRVSSGGIVGGAGTRRGSKGIKFDKKYLVFGDKPPEGTYFLANIQRMLQYSLEGMLVAADTYYRNKGLRAVTRPQAIQDNFDGCAEVIAQRLQNYNQQTEKFYNDALQVFRKQVRDLEHLVSACPELVMKQFLNERLAALREARPSAELELKVEQLAAQRKKFEDRLHPELGHPNRTSDLEALDVREQERHKECEETIQICSNGVTELLNRQATAFCSDLAKLSEQLLLQYDNLLLIEDVNMGNFGMKSLPAEELVRRKALGLPLQEPEEAPVVSRGRGSWSGIPLNTLKTPAAVEIEEKDVVQSPSINTLKSSEAHANTEKATQQLYRDYVEEFRKVAEANEKKFRHQLKQESRWSQNWTQSVNKIKAIY